MSVIADTVPKFVKEWIRKLALMLENDGKILKVLPPEIEARLRVQKLIDYDKGLHLDYLTTLINQQFTSNNFRNELLVRPNIRNLVGFLADTVSVNVRDGVRVETANEKDQKIFNQIRDANRWDNFCRTLARMLYLCKTVFVRVWWNYQDSQLYMEVIPPTFTEIETDEYDPYRIARIGYPDKVIVKDVQHPKGTFFVWDDKNFYKTDEKGDTLFNSENPDNVNPYGIIPVVTFRETEPLEHEFYNWPGAELVNSQDNLNVKLTQRNYLLYRFTIPIPVITSASFKNGKFPKVDGQEVLVLQADNIEGREPKFEFVTPDVPLDKVLAVIEDEIRAILMSQGVDYNAILPSADRQSGLSIKQMEAKTAERWATVKLSMQYGLEEVVDVWKIIWNKHNPDNQLSDDPVSIQIVEPKSVYISSVDKWADRNENLNKNLKSVVDFLLEDRDDVSDRAQAQKIIDQNAKENQSVGTSKLISGLLAPPPAESPVPSTSLSGV